MHKIDSYEWGDVWADERDPNAGGASHCYLVQPRENKEGENIPVWVQVQFQHGPRNAEDSTEGCLDDHILAICEDRLDAFQAGPFACPANAIALCHIQSARAILRERAEERRGRGVLGKNEV